MRRSNIILGIILLCFSGSALAKLTMSVEAGAQVDYLRWNISGANAGIFVDIRSELTFQPVYATSRLNMHWEHDELPIWVSGSYSKGILISGDVADKDWNQSSRRAIFSSSTHKSENQDSSSGNFRAGYVYQVSDKLSISPNFGIQWQKNKLDIRGGSNSLIAGSDFTNLNSRYQSEWLALTVGSVFEYKVSKPLSLLLDASLYPYTHYEGEGIWSLRRGFQQNPSFRHSGGGGIGGSLALQARWHFSPNWLMGVGWRGQLFYLNEPSSSTNTFFFATGDIGSAPFREAIQTSNFFFINLQYQWH